MGLFRKADNPYETLYRETLGRLQDTERRYEQLLALYLEKLNPPYQPPADPETLDDRLYRKQSKVKDPEWVPFDVNNLFEDIHG